MSNKSIDVPLNKAKEFVCSKCGNRSFNAIYLMKKIPAEHSPKGQVLMIPTQAFECAKCSHIDNEFYLASGYNALNYEEENE